MNARDKIIALLLFLGGITLFVLSLIPGTSPSDAGTPDLYYRTNDPLDLSTYEYKLPNAESTSSPSLEKVGDSTKAIMAMYLMPATACSNCLNEVDEYVELINDKYSSLNLDQIIWFHAETEQYARQFALITDFQVPKIYSVTPFLPPRLTVFNKETSGSQLIFIDKSTERIFFRVRLPSGAITPVEDKVLILDELATLLESHPS